MAGAGLRIRVATHWYEPLLLWQALVGGPSSGKSAAFARVRTELEAVGPGYDSGGGAASLTPQVLVDAPLDRLDRTLGDMARGVLLWREDLADWWEEAGRRAARPAWLAGWNAGPAMIDGQPKACFAVSLLGALSPEDLGGRLAPLTAGTGGLAGKLDSALASRFLYVWPERGRAASFAETEADDICLHGLLQKISAEAGHRETPSVLWLDEEGTRRLETLMPAVRQLADECDDTGGGGVAAEWIGRGVSTIVRLAGVLSLMAWAENKRLPESVGAAHIDAAYELWSGYYLPHALAVFDRAGAGQGTGRGDRAARRVVRWLKRVRAPEISREDVRREALCQSVDAQGAEEVLARLEAGGFLREVAVTEPTRRGPRRRRWEVNPLLGQAASRIGAISATPLPPSLLGARHSSDAS